MIEQAYISKSVDDFPWLERLGLEPYHDKEKPAVFYGMYREEDYTVLHEHKGAAIIRWCGDDALKYTNDEAVGMVRHISPLPKVRELLLSKGINCEAITPENIFAKTSATMCDESIYAYVVQTYPQYHNARLVNEIIRRGWGVVIGDGSIPQSKWGSVCDKYYKSYIGLMLSEFAGGGFSVVEMGLRGKYCITNVIDSPNTLSWQTIDDVIMHLEHCKQHIGTINNELAEKVKQSIGDHSWLHWY